MSTASLKDLVVHIGDNQSFADVLKTKNLDNRSVDLNGRMLGRVEFGEVNKIGGGTAPTLRFNYEGGFRAADVGHDIMGHLMMHSLRQKGELGKHLAEFFGFKENGGIIPDAIIADKLARRALVTIPPLYVKLNVAPEPDPPVHATGLVACTARKIGV
jgi:hypothetical protein